MANQKPGRLPPEYDSRRNGPNIWLPEAAVYRGSKMPKIIGSACGGDIEEENNYNIYGKLCAVRSHGCEMGVSTNPKPT